MEFIVVMYVMAFMVIIQVCNNIIVIMRVYIIASIVARKVYISIYRGNVR